MTYFRSFTCKPSKKKTCKEVFPSISYVYFINI